MPSLNVEFTAEELERVRSLATLQGLALKPYVKAAALASDRQRDIEAIAMQVADNSRELLERLA